VGTLKALFVITVSTSRFFFPGTPASFGTAENAKPPAVKSLSLEIASNVAAPSGAKATVDVPQGLKTAAQLRLSVEPNLPKPVATNAPAVTVAQYWGIGRKIGGDQPKLTKQTAQSSLPEGFPDKSYAYWPPTNSKPLADDVDISGVYKFKTNYCGDAEVTLAKGQGLLDPIDITSADNEPDLTKPIVVKWKPVPNAVGYIFKAYGGTAGKSVTWTSSTKPELADTIDYRPVSKTDLDDYIKQGVLLPPYVITCTIPAGIFNGSSSVMLTMTAVGRDIVQTQGDTETWVVIRSTASVPLHSSAFPAPKPAEPAPANPDSGDGGQ